jgi:hypothetical protein
MTAMTSPFRLRFVPAASHRRLSGSLTRLGAARPPERDDAAALMRTGERYYRAASWVLLSGAAVLGIPAVALLAFLVYAAVMRL